MTDWAFHAGHRDLQSSATGVTQLDMAQITDTHQPLTSEAIAA